MSLMFKDTLQTDILFQIQLHHLKNLWPQWFIIGYCCFPRCSPEDWERTYKPVALIKPHMDVCKQLTLQKGLSFPLLPLLGDSQEER